MMNGDGTAAPATSDVDPGSDALAPTGTDRPLDERRGVSGDLGFARRPGDGDEPCGGEEREGGHREELADHTTDLPESGRPPPPPAEHCRAPQSGLDVTA